MHGRRHRRGSGRADRATTCEEHLWRVKMALYDDVAATPRVRLHPMLAHLLGRPCRACGRRARLHRMGPVAPTHPGPFHTSHFSLVHCPRCEVVYLDPVPTADDLRVMYEGSVQFDGPHYTDAQRVEQVFEYCNDAINRLALLPPPGGRM